MLINAPVYSNQNNTHFVNIYSETEDGTFKRTQDEPLRLLRDDISGISMPQGELVSSHYDRGERSWSTATVTYHYGKPQSFYQFLRDMLARNKFFVFSKPVLSGHLYKFDIHELKLKPSTSQRKISILKEKYTEAISLWSQKEHDEHVAQVTKTEKTRLVRVANAGHRQAGNTKRPTTSFDANSTRVIDFTHANKNRLATKEREVESSDLAEKSALIKKEDNPFKEKSMFRHTHFLRRFIFDRS